ncbi:hypothetical protein [Corynebacterium rouxii]|uniref:hypothetical protein n=1 Tax=Corynebacterium rouxii TaxID=2719119 RepID=UPI0012DF6CDA
MTKPIITERGINRCKRATPAAVIIAGRPPVSAMTNGMITENAIVSEISANATVNPPMISLRHITNFTFTKHDRDCWCATRSSVSSISRTRKPQEDYCIP